MGLLDILSLGDLLRCWQQMRQLLLLVMADVCYFFGLFLNLIDNNKIIIVKGSVDRGAKCVYNKVLFNGTFR